MFEYLGIYCLQVYILEIVYLLYLYNNIATHSITSSPKSQVNALTPSVIISGDRIFRK